MKALLLVTGLVVGSLLGYWARALNPSTIYNAGVFVSSPHSSGYPLQAFATVNREMPELLSRVSGTSDYEHLSYVVPDLGDYAIVLPECSHGRSLSEQQRDQLFSLIGDRMREAALAATSATTPK